MAFPATPVTPSAYATSAPAPNVMLPFPTSPGDPNAAPTKSLADVEMEYILQVYAKNGMNKQKTSDELGISLKTLYNKLHKYEEERQRRAG
jgi:DNA-binding NtrC family response regulator